MHPLRRAIEAELAHHSLASLAQAAAELSDRYRSRRPLPDRFITTETQRLAYAAVRMPATFAAARAVFAELRRRMPDTRIRSLLDLGAGPGTASWAAAEVFAELERVTLVEQDAGLIELGASLARSGGQTRLERADLRRADLRAMDSFPPHDLIVCSYTLNEIEREVSRKILRLGWQAARAVAVVIEPGAMAGFDLVRTLRDDLIEAGAHLIAPCPHSRACPMPDGDWCHFAARFERSSLHRRIKSGALGYEDEKFAYLAVSRQPASSAEARIIRRPQRHTGFVELSLCANDDLRTVTITRRDNAHWRRARKADWGDEWP
jgi:ribosomal protein RSM22 (predicted rRNA methylase)